MRPLVARCVARSAQLWVSATLRGPPPVCRWGRRPFRTSRVVLISMADRIKQFLPREATEEESETASQPFQTSLSPSGSGLSAFAAEIREIEALVTQGELALACQQLLNELPLQAVLNALVDRIVPLVAKGPLADLGVYELAFNLHILGQPALAGQLLQSAVPMEIGTVKQRAEFDIIHSLRSGVWTAQDVDLTVQQHTDTFFPQVLQARYSRWFKARLLAALDENSFEIYFRRWCVALLPEIGPSGIALLIITNRSTFVYDVVKTYVLHGWNAEYVNALVRATTTAENLSRVWFQLRKALTDGAHLSSDPVLAVAVPSALRSALQLKQTYRFAEICRYGAVQLEQHPNIVAKALLAAAFAQKRPDTTLDSVVVSRRQDLQTFLVGRVLTPVLHDSVKCDHVVAMAAKRLKEGGVSSRVLWQLVLSLPPDTALGPRSSRALAQIIASRPHVEQLRYMALPIVTSEGVCEVLRLGLDRMVAHRRVNRIPTTTHQSEEDVNLLMAGIVLASEKLENSDPAVEERELSRMVDSVFEPWSGAASSDVISSAARASKGVASTIVQQVINMLVLRKSYTIALQVLRLTKGRQRPATLEMLLMGIATDMPARTHMTISWLVRTLEIPIPPYILNRVLVQLCKSPLLSETQLKNQFQDIRRLMLTKLKAVINSASAKALVEVLLNSAVVHRKGSRTRLRWALHIAKLANVSKRDFARWTHRLEHMQENKQGYWAA